MNYMDTCQYREIHANELEIPKYCIRVLLIHFIVRKIDISCEVIRSLLFYFFYNTLMLIQ
ncbi:hypothetical protein DN393_20755 [Bacillus sp. BPN334]|nr:hypothetical protein DN393_20755 [Bacillus sp. BPN334]